MAINPQAGILTNARTTTGRDSISLSSAPNIVVLFVSITGTASIDIEISDDDVTFFPLETVTAKSTVRIAVPASVIAANITSVSGTVNIRFRALPLAEMSDQAISLFTSGSLVIFTQPIEGIDAHAAAQTMKPLALSGRDSGGLAKTLQTDADGKLQVTSTPSTTSTIKKLAQAQPGITPTTLYTVPASTSTKIKHIRITNPTGVDRTIELWHDGSTDAFQILPPVTVEAGGWGEFEGSVFMETGDTLSAEASAATSIVVTVYGEELS